MSFVAPKRDVCVGILGGGQLARMLAQAAEKMGTETWVLTGAADDPASRLCPAVIGSLEEARVLRRFFSEVQLVTFENEFVDTGLLARFATEFPKLRFEPKLVVLERLQDKLNQKELLGRLGIPTAPWVVKADPAACADLPKTFPKGAVLKWSRMGYDGKGLLFYDPAKPDPKALAAFFEAAAQREARVYAEQTIAFRRELAVVACRSAKGEFAAYPLVQSRQDRGICSLVTGPARLLGNTAEQESRAVGYAKRITEALDYVGVLALELFERPDGEILVNEIAPRVHNSGHFTQDACEASQFENHLRAILGLPLGSTSVKGTFAMLNILGPEGVSRPSQALPVAPAGATLHWYEKRELRPRRKMGHFNGTATGADGLAKMVQSLEAAERKWTQEVSK